MNDATTINDQEPAQLSEWKNPPTLTQLKQDFSDARNEYDAHINAVGIWLDNLNITGKAKIAKVKHKSNVQPKLIRKQAEWRYASLSEPFLSTPDVFNVRPVTFEDKEAAEQNQLVLNHQFNNLLNKVAFVDEYVRTAVDEGTVVVRTGWVTEEEHVTKTVPTYASRPNNDPQFTQHIQQAAQLAQSDPNGFKQQVPETLRMSIESSAANQAPTEVYETGSEEVVETVTLKNQPTATVCDYRDTVIDPTCKGNMDDAKFVIYKFLTSKSDLRASSLDYQNIDDINPSGASPLADPDSHETPDNGNFNFDDEPRKQFLAHEYWGYWDINDDGVVKPFVATWVGETLIRLEESPFPDKALPFVVVPFLPVRKSLYGEPDGELTKDNQEIVGAVTRGMIDILASNANGQKGTQKNALDVTNKRRYQEGKGFEFNPNIDPRMAFHVGAFAEIPTSAQFMLQQQSMDAESLTGVKAFNNGISGEALGATATGVRGALDASSKREVGILRRLAQGMVEIGRKFVSMNSEFLSDEEVVRITNDKFVAISREALAGKFDLSLSISTAEEDNQKAQELAFMLQTTGPSSDPSEVRMIRAEIARLRKMPDLSKKIEEYQPEPDPLDQAKKQLENKLLEAQIAETIAESQQRAAVAEYNMSRAKEADSKSDLNNLEFVEKESGVTQERTLQKQGEQAKSNAKLEMVKDALAQRKDPDKE